jgi:CRP-like cAMP-binding protein
MNDVGSPVDNHLLSSLPSDVRERLEPHLEHLNAELNKRIYGPYEEIAHVYFPINSMASIVASTESGEMAEVGVVGREGAVGVDIAMGANNSPHRSMFQIAGTAYRMSGSEFEKEFKRNGDFHNRILNFVQKLYAQVSQTTLCNRLHHVEERLPRWLLMCHDRIDGDILPLTQDCIALMLGASRVSITLAAKDLQTIGYIKYVRGKITVLDREGLEDGACECYNIVKREYDRTYV